MGATAWEYWLRGQSPQDKPSCITDGNLFQGQNVGQLCRPPPFATFDLTTLPLTAPIRLLHSPRCHPYLSNDSSVHPAVTPGGGGGGLWSLCPQSAGSHFHSPSTFSLWITFHGKLPCTHCGRGLFRTRQWNPKTSPLKREIASVFKALLIQPPLHSFWGRHFFSLNNIFWLLWPFFWLLFQVSWQRKRSVIVFGS